MRKMPRQTAPLVQPVDDRKVKHVPSKHTFTAGQKVGMWTFLTDTVRQKNWARCDCGTERHVWARNVSLRKSTSCGCADVGRIGRQSVTHGQSEHELYAVWVAMIARCHNTTDPRYPAYGGRGLVVCDAWRESIDQFLLDIGPRPEGHTLDRVDNDDGYHPSNCRWADWRVQSRNKSNNRWLEACGRNEVFADWMDLLEISTTGFKSLLRNHPDFMDTVYVNADGLYDSPLIQRGARNPRTRRLQESKSGS